jgi:ABC-type transport system substrate-binding protein
MEMRIIGEYAQRRAQLITRNLWTTDLLAADVLPVKQEQPRLNLYAGSFPDDRPIFTGFGMLPGSPFHDVRVRRAMSMLVDRDGFIDAFFQVREFESQGLPMETRWNTHFAAGEPPYWIDPKPAISKLGEGAAYFKHNPGEAAKLVRAAGFTEPIRLQGHFNTFFDFTGGALWTDDRCTYRDVR